MNGSVVKRTFAFLHHMFGVAPPAQLHASRADGHLSPSPSGFQARQGGGQFALYGTLAQAAQRFIEEAVWAQTPGVVFQLQSVGVYLPPALQDFAHGFSRTPAGAVLSATRAQLLQSDAASRLDVSRLASVRVLVGGPTAEERLDAVDTLFDSALDVQRQPVQVVFFGEPVAAAAPTRLYSGGTAALRIWRAGAGNDSKEVREFPCVIGRAHDAHVRIDDDYVSRVHAVISEDPHGRLVIEDRSVHGTFLDGDCVGRGSRRSLPDSGQLLLLAANERDGGIAIGYERAGATGGPTSSATPLARDRSTPVMAADVRPARRAGDMLHVRTGQGLERISSLHLPQCLQEGTTRLLLKNGGAASGDIVVELECGSATHRGAPAHRVFLWRRHEKLGFPNGAMAWFDQAATEADA